MSTDIETFIAQNFTWEKLPTHMKQLLGNSQKEYDKKVIQYCIKTQQSYTYKLVGRIIKDQKTYYEEVVGYSQAHLMLFPYHLSEFIICGLRLTPFQYYITLLIDIMTSERSYDSLPNFTAADCLRLLGIGRNQYIDIMNQCRSSRKLFRKKNVRELLPLLPVDINIEPWWIVNIGHVMEDDIKNLVKEKEKLVIDLLIDSGPQRAGCLEKQCVHSLYMKGLVYLDVPINDNDVLTVPPLEGFVMNRILGDYLESLMYKIFISLDEHTPVIELAKVLEMDISLVKRAVSLFCRLGFAHRRTLTENEFEFHSSWSGPENEAKKNFPTSEDLLLLELESALAESPYDSASLTSDCLRTPTEESLNIFGANSNNGSQAKRIAFLYDSTLTAFLMMGNLSPDLKNHAVTMFEVGKLLDEGLSSLVTELEKIQRSDSEGEAQRYFEHALTLKVTINFLRHNPHLMIHDNGDLPPALDLIRWESLSNLEPATTARLLKKNYQCLVSMAPLCYEIPLVKGEMPPHFGPPVPEANSVWFKLFLYHLTGSGPPSLLLPKGIRLRSLPSVFMEYEKVLVTPWSHDPTVISLASIFVTVNEALMHSPVFIQAYGWYHDVCIQHVPFPIDETSIWANHKVIEKLSSRVDLEHSFGYLKFVAFLHPSKEGVANFGTDEIKTGVPSNLTSGVGIPKVPQVLSFEDIATIDGCATNEDLLRKECPEVSSSFPSSDEWMLLECNFGLPLFNAGLNEEISKQIISHSLFKADSLEAFVASSERLSSELMDFIDEYQAVKNNLQRKEKKLGSESPSNLPFPTKPLLFSKGVLSLATV